MKNVLREPLLHFLLLGAAVFLAYRLLNDPGRGAEPGRIVVTQGKISQLATGFARTWQRPPSDAEMKGLIDDWVREEIAVREASALGLDKDDTVIRRRLRQKLEFVSQDIAALAEPSEADLVAYLRANADAFRIEPRLTFTQVYLDRQRRGESLSQDVARLLAQLNQPGSNAEVSLLGDSLLLEHSFTALPASEIARQFGEAFSAQVSALRPGEWHGPIESGYGVHLVRVSRRDEGRLPELGEVRDVVRREWANARRLATNAAFYDELLKRYAVTIEPPEPTTGPNNLAAAK